MIVLDDIINKSLCSECEYLVERVLSTEGVIVLDEDDNQIDDLEEINHFYCGKLCLDIDYIVLHCSVYKNKNK